MDLIKLYSDEECTELHKRVLIEIKNTIFEYKSGNLFSKNANSLNELNSEVVDYVINNMDRTDQIKLIIYFRNLSITGYLHYIGKVSEQINKHLEDLDRMKHDEFEKNSQTWGHILNIIKDCIIVFDFYHKANC